ncbi:manganese transporter [Tabrizicola sp. TH137]|uniref:metal ABC transporter solute-binding protein, Zn/Mn family n=1 Tax=Tabrizicola sp. TH137 TaxID=2067452 RepID=UPI000C7C6557|nr:zinc ABC transporter substrate-binding protein [Tabrizicola sp. TH137]PLL10982.1 manganese transporter [Tabrizicola sp. TH137]
MIDRRSLLGCFALAPFAGTPALAASATPTIVTTTGMIADAARRLSGLPVQALMGPGMDPHGHRPTRTDILALSRADVILWHGLNLEAQFTEVLQDLARKTTVAAVAETLPRDRLMADPEYADRPDPHVWFDPRLWSDVVRAVDAALTGAGVDTADNAATYLEEIAQLDVYARQSLATVPERQRILVTAHDAFAYFGRAYGWRVEGIQGISTESEAGLARIEELVTLIVENEIPAVFVESSVSDRSIRALIEGAGARGHNVTIGAELFSDAMGPDGTYEGTYPGMIDHNITAIARALGGDAPERGMAGRLNAGT